MDESKGSTEIRLLLQPQQPKWVTPDSIKSREENASWYIR